MWDCHTTLPQRVDLALNGYLRNWRLRTRPGNSHRQIRKMVTPPGAPFQREAWRVSSISRYYSVGTLSNRSRFHAGLTAGITCAVTPGSVPTFPQLSQEGDKPPSPLWVPLFLTWSE